MIIQAACVGKLHVGLKKFLFVCVCVFTFQPWSLCLHLYKETGQAGTKCCNASRSATLNTPFVHVCQFVLILNV